MIWFKAECNRSRSLSLSLDYDFGFGIDCRITVLVWRNLIEFLTNGSDSVSETELRQLIKLIKKAESKMVAG